MKHLAGILAFVVVMVLLAVTAFGEIAGSWNVLTNDGIVRVELVGCTFSPCMPNGGDEVIINEEPQRLFWHVKDGVITFKSWYGHGVVTEGVANEDVIQLLLDGVIYTLVKAEQ